MKVTRWLWCIVLALGLCGCAAKAETDTVTFMVFGDPAEFAAYERLVAAFTAQYPDIHVELGHVPGQEDYRQRLALDFTAGAPPDVMLLNYRRFAQFADQGGLAPLDAYLTQSDVLNTEDFFPVALEAFQFEEQLWCIPQNVSSLVVYYNRDLFDAAGLPYPAGDWTQADFLALAQALTQDTDGDGVTDQYGVGLEPNLFRLAPFIWQNGGDLVDDPDRPTRLTLDTPPALQALEWFAALQTQYHVAPDAVAEATISSEDRFLNGQLAMFFNSRRGVPTYRTIQSFVWDVAPLPGGAQRRGILHSDGYCMAATAANKDAVWTFIEFANSDAGQTVIATTGRTVPSLRAVAESPAFLDAGQPPANSQVYLDTLDDLGRVPTMPGWPFIEELASREIERAFYGQASVAEAAAAAVAATQPYFEQP